MIYPKVQRSSLSGTPIILNGVNVIGELKEKTEKVLSQYGIRTDGTFTVEAKIINSKKTTYIDSLSRLSDEKYFITVSESKAVIEAATARGVFRATNTLAKLIVNSELKTGEIEDYPLFAKRGYIEGFYGPTWEKSKRRSVMKLMARYGMNTFYYAPKDDIYHRDRWRDPYPKKEAEELRELFEEAEENELDFHWCIGPGLTYKYTSDDDFDALIGKIRSVYEIGVRGFGLLFDDIPDEFQYEEDEKAFDSIVDAHIALINRVYSVLKEIDSSIYLTVCPTQYHGDESEYYITKFGRGIPADVSVFWTGAEICSRVIRTSEADAFLRSTGHIPLYWDNYPVNDCEMYHEMHLGALIGRDKELYKHCEGLISNVMEYAECSKIPLLTVADFLWNPICYDSEKSLENARKEILGDKAALFAYIADHLCVSCLTRHASVLMSDTLSHIGFLMSTDRPDEAAAEFARYNTEMRKCLDMISDTSVPLFEEMQKWVKKFAMCCDLLDAVLSAAVSPTAENKSTLSALLERYNSDAVILAGFCLRETAEKVLKM